MVQQWPKGFCFFNVAKCKRVPPADFTIHGLWPANFTRILSNCTLTRYVEIKDKNQTSGWRGLSASAPHTYSSPAGVSPRCISLSLTNNREDNCVILLKRFVKDENKQFYHSILTKMMKQKLWPVPYLVHHFVQPFWLRNGVRFSNRRLGLGFDPNTGDYKIVKLVHFEPDEYDLSLYSFRAEIYNLSTNCWRQLDAVLPYIGYLWCFSLLFNGCYHWRANDIETYSAMILSFDISNEVFREINFPPNAVVDEELQFYTSNIVVLDNSLALLIRYSYTRPPNIGDPVDQLIDIWMMMDYGVESSWMKRYSLGPISGIECPLSSWTNDKLLVETENNGQLGSYAFLENNGRGVLKAYNVYGYPISLQAFIYKESLVSLY
ncbi:hypothetical protein ACH5RR_014188 [Cinchona calisaya]|uniref:F-box associated beta-propeller type 1 domain-containing protein n=1 Tax=Cinchona calisaya TaxID=153742 RepID=A0ABD3A253_9GENT